MKKIWLGVLRDECFSPRSVDRDTAILQTVGKQLSSTEEYEVHYIRESHTKELRKSLSECEGVFSMARSTEALLLMSEKEKQGVTVVNSAQALLHLNRRNLLKLCRTHGISVPHHYTSESEGFETQLTYPVWLKRDDRTTQNAHDVQMMHTPHELNTRLEQWRAEGVTDYVCEEHITGDLIKFYGVEGTDFFYYLHPTAHPNGFSKFGAEAANGHARGYTFDANELQQQIQRLAKVSGLTVFGGDAVVKADGTFYLIDFNDWPSFAPCRTEAAQTIAQRLLQLHRER